MLINIFDVGHGLCAMVTGPNGKRLMIDCGIRSDPFWSPSVQFLGQSVEALLLTNLDEDHLENFKYVQELMRFGTVWFNNSIDAGRLLALKKDGMGQGVNAFYNSLLRGTHRFNIPVDFSPLQVALFRFDYGQFADTNNLSLVTFIEYAGVCIVFPGDLEKSGWQAALANPNPIFLNWLRRVNLFVCSHHGRENGCCDALFDICKPAAFIFSDKEKEHETQETCSWYGQRALGLNKLIQTPWDKPEVRRVFTTRNDGCLSIEVRVNGDYVVWTKTAAQTDFSPKINSTASLAKTLPAIAGSLSSLATKKLAGSEISLPNIFPPPPKSQIW